MTKNRPFPKGRNAKTWGCVWCDAWRATLSEKSSSVSSTRTGSRGYTTISCTDMCNIREVRGCLDIPNLNLSFFTHPRRTITHMHVRSAITRYLSWHYESLLLASNCAGLLIFYTSHLPEWNGVCTYEKSFQCIRIHLASLLLTESSNGWAWTYLVLTNTLTLSPTHPHIY